MLAKLSNLLGLAKGLLPSGWSLALYAAAALAIAGGAAWTMHRVDLATIEAMKLAAAKAETAAVMLAKAQQAAQDGIALAAAVDEATAQQKIVVRTVTTVKEIPRYVQDTAHCITYGLVRVLDGGALGVYPADLALPAGKSNDTCAPVTASALADSVFRNYSAALANAEQLTRLQDTVRAMVAAANGEGK